MTRFLVGIFLLVTIKMVGQVEQQNLSLNAIIRVKGDMPSGGIIGISETRWVSYSLEALVEVEGSLRAEAKAGFVPFYYKGVRMVFCPFYLNGKFFRNGLSYVFRYNTPSGVYLMYTSRKSGITYSAGVEIYKKQLVESSTIGWMTNFSITGPLTGNRFGHK